MPNPTSFQTFKSYNPLQGFAFQSWIIQKNLIRPPSLLFIFSYNVLFLHLDSSMTLYQLAMAAK